MYFNRKNTQMKNWRMRKKGKHFLFGCSLFIVGAMVASTQTQVIAVSNNGTDTMQIKPRSLSVDKYKAALQEIKSLSHLSDTEQRYFIAEVTKLAKLLINKDAQLEELMNRARKLDELYTTNRGRTQADAIQNTVDSNTNHSVNGHVRLTSGGRIGDDAATYNAPLEGVEVYAQWYESNGFASPIYKTVTKADGSFSIGMHEFIGADGKLYQFNANPQAGVGVAEKWRIWTVNKDTNKYTLLYSYGEEQISPEGIVLDTSAGAVQHVAKGMLTDIEVRYAYKNDDIWKQGAVASPAATTGANAGGRVSGSVYWNNFNPSGSLLWNDLVSRQDKKDIGLSNVTVYASYLSDWAVEHLNSENVMQQFVDATSKWQPSYNRTTKEGNLRGTNWTRANEDKLKDYILQKVKEDRNKWIAETVSTKTNAKGEYTLQFNGTYGQAWNDPGFNGVLETRKSVLRNESTVTNGKGEMKKGTEWTGTVAESPTYGKFASTGADSKTDLSKAPKHINTEWLIVTTEMDGISFTTPFYGNVPKGPSSISNQWGVDGVGAGSAWGVTTTLGTKEIPGNNDVKNVRFAAFHNDLKFDVLDYDSVKNYAKPGDTVKTSTIGVTPVGSEKYEIVWKDETGKEVAKNTQLSPDNTGKLPETTYTVPADLTKTTTYFAELYALNEDGTRPDYPIQKDSFTAVYREVPVYEVTKGNEGTATMSMKPTFDLAHTTDVEKRDIPKDATFALVSENGETVDGFKIDAKTGVITWQNPQKDEEVTVEVTYADGHTETTVAKFILNKPDKDKYEPVAKEQTVAVNDTPKASDSIENFSELPAGTTATFKAAVDTSNPGQQKAIVVVKYPDNTTDEVEVTINVVDGGKQTDNINPVVPPKTTVGDVSKLTDEEKKEVADKIKAANDNFPDNTKIVVGDDGTTTITYPDQSTDTIQGSQLVESKLKTYADKITPILPDRLAVDDVNHLSEEEKTVIVESIKEENKNQFPDNTTVTIGDDGTVTITYPDSSTATIPGKDLVVQKVAPDAKHADVITPNIPEKTLVDDVTNLTADEMKQVKEKIEKANEAKFHENTQVTVAANGTATITYPDQSVDVIEGDKLVEAKTDTQRITPVLPTITEVANVKNLTDDEIKQVEDKIKQVNNQFPANTTVSVAADGTATITYPDKTTDTIPGTSLVKQKGNTQTDAQRIMPKVPEKTLVNDVMNLTEEEKVIVANKVMQANVGNFPDGTQVNVQKDGTAVIVYPDKSIDSIIGTSLVEKRVPKQAETIDPTVPEKTQVEDVNNLTSDEKTAIADKINEANKGKFPDDTKVSIAADGTATITYPDGSNDTILGTDLVKKKEQSSKQTDSITPNVPEKTPVANINQLTVHEKLVVEEKIKDANKGNFPDRTTVTVADDGTATITYPDGSTDVISGKELVKQHVPTHAETITPTIPTKTPVDDVMNLTDEEKTAVENKVMEANKDVFPPNTTVSVAKDGTVTITYPDDSTDVISGADLVNKKSPKDADRITPNVPEKTIVDDVMNLTDEEKKEVEQKINMANRDTFIPNTTVSVAKDGTATITYPDGSTDVINGSELVAEKAKTDAQRITPNVPTKTTVEDTTNLTDAEKAEVANKVNQANSGQFPAGTTVSVAKDGTATIIYPDGSTDVINGSELVAEKAKTDAQRITPSVPTKTTVGDTTNLTDAEKAEVSNKVNQANSGQFPAGTAVQVAADGTATIIYPDGSTDVINGSELVEAKVKTDAQRITPNVPTKTTVGDTTNLTDAEKAEVSNKINQANGSQFPAGTVVQVAKDGTATITYPDGSVDTILGTKLVALKDNTKANKQTKAKIKKDSKGHLPKTGDSTTAIATVGASLIAASLLVGAQRRRKKD